MRILFTSPAAHGHVQPMVPLARAAMAAGHEVRWATGADACAILRASFTAMRRISWSAQRTLARACDSRGLMFPRLRHSRDDE